MDFRHLGRSGLIVSEISFGNWLTHGGQIEEDQAAACVHAALDSGVTTFDTADVYTAGRAEEVLGRALAGERREGLEVFTKVFWPMGEGRNDRGLSRKHLMEGIDASLRRLQLDYVDLHQAHRYDVETPLEETMQAFADIVRAGKALYVGVSEWTAEQIREARALADELGLGFVSNQPQYSALWRVIEGDVVPTCTALGIGQVVWSPIAGGVLTGKYAPGWAPPSPTLRRRRETRRVSAPDPRDLARGTSQRRVLTESGGGSSGRRPHGHPPADGPGRRLGPAGRARPRRSMTRHRPGSGSVRPAAREHRRSRSHWSRNARYKTSTPISL